MASLVCDKLFSMITDKINSIVDEEKDNFCSDPKTTLLNKINGSIAGKSAYFLVPANVKEELSKSLDQMKSDPEFVKVCSETDNNKVKEGINTFIQNMKNNIPLCKSGNSMPTGGKRKVKRKTLRKTKKKATRKSK